MLAGQYHSVFKGRGMAFSEVRQYQPGDEVRTIDWNVTARMNDAYVKVFTEERELTVMLLVDVSASRRVRLARRAPRPRWPPRSPRMIAFSAIANNDRVGLMLFSDRVEKVVPPRKGTQARAAGDHRHPHLHSRRARGTDLAAGLTWLAQVAKRKTVAFLISDFIAEGYEKALRIVGAQARPGAGGDRRPAGGDSFPSLGIVDLEDPETRRARAPSTPPTRAFAAASASLTAKRREERDRNFKKLRSTRWS